jgi:prepilin-type N-terminal cleavage/methylation domain-containing protein
MNRRGSTKRFSPAFADRAGFSLIEILVVMGIIAFLTAAIVVILPRVANASKIAATRATIKKVDELLNDRINGFQRWIQTQNTLAGNNPPSYVLGTQYATSYSQNPQLYQFLAAKLAFQKAFPQNFSELGGSYVSKNPTTESAACLYVILTQKAVFDTEPPSAAELRGAEIGDTDGDGNPEILDAWAAPLRYYRWPTRLFRPAPTAATVQNQQVSVATMNNVEEGPAPTPFSILIRSAPRGPALPWSGTSAYSVGQTIQPTSLVPGNLMIYQCTTSTPPGTPGGSQPNWANATSPGQTVQDGTNIVWTAVLDPLTIDSDDPNGLAPATLVNESNFHTWATFHVPLIVSCGTDGALGLYEPNQTGSSGNFGNLAQPHFDPTDPSGFARNDLYDNITNHQ